MLFNSIEFAVFLPVVFLIYWFLINKNLSLQNAFIILASYIFYGWWDWRFLSLIVFSSTVDYAVGIGLSNSRDPFKRKMLLLLSVLVNIGFLGFFKYFNFFAESFADAFTLLGQPFEASRLNIILPVGISFYTFQTMSYTIDVYREKIKPTRDILAFFAFVSFFPQLVAGPIERASNLLPQFYKKRIFDPIQAADGLKQILWGLFKKVVIADNCAMLVDNIFANYTEYSGSTLVLGGVLFAFQIYGDFSGYSDIAIGTAKLFGFKLMRNFAFPYFSRDIAEFWRRWHISLSTWFRDYLYIPLGGSRGGTWMKIRNTMVIFIVSGFWHGANWTFIVWGFINACYFLPLMLLQQNRKNTDTVAEGKFLPNVREVFQVALTFALTVIAWIVFRSESMGQAIDYYAGIFSASLFEAPDVFPVDLMFIIFAFTVVEWFSREKDHPFEYVNLQPGKWIANLRFAAMSLTVWAIILWGAFDHKEFIYFQF